MQDRNQTNDRLNDLIDAGISENTRRAYREDVPRFWDWAKQTHNIQSQYPIPIAELSLIFMTDC